MRPANLASHPFVNERLPNLVFAVATVVMLGLTVRHAFLARALLPGRTSALHDEVTRLEDESKRLRSEQARLRGVAPEKNALARWVVVKDLVDRRAFSWTGLFARLEERLPDRARLVSIAPTVRRGEIVLDVRVVVQSPEVGWHLVRALEEGGAFEDVFPLTEGEGGDFHYTMRYRPRATRSPLAGAVAAPPSPGESPSDAAAGVASTHGPGVLP
jgi:hypothetical protein